MTKDKALKIALGALEDAWYEDYGNKEIKKAITAIEEALSQPKQEPVAWATEEDFYRELEHELKHIREEIKRLNEKIEFLARANMLYSDWEHRETQVTSDLIRKGIEASKLNVELLSALSACLDYMEQLRTSGDAGNWDWRDDVYTRGRAIEAKLKDKNT